MEYTTADLYWEDSTTSWYKSSQDKQQYYFHNDIVSCWSSSNKIWSRTFYEAKKKLHNNTWNDVAEKFVRDIIKLSHYKDGWRGRMEYPGATNQNYGNQATTYESSLGKGDKKRFTLLLDDDIYDEIIAAATIKNMRRNTYINGMMRIISDREFDVYAPAEA